MCELCTGEFEPKLTVEICRLALRRQRLDDFGPLHAIIEDTNIEDEHIDSALSGQDLSPLERAFCQEFRMLNEEDRISTLALAANLYGATSIHGKPA